MGNVSCSAEEVILKGTELVALAIDALVENNRASCGVEAICQYAETSQEGEDAVDVPQGTIRQVAGQSSPNLHRLIILNYCMIRVRPRVYEKNWLKDG